MSTGRYILDRVCLRSTVQAGPILTSRPGCAPPAVTSEASGGHAMATHPSSSIVSPTIAGWMARPPLRIRAVIWCKGQQPPPPSSTNIKLTSPPTNPQLPRNIDIPLSIPLPTRLQPRHHILIPFPHTPTIRTRHLPTSTGLPPLGSRLRLKTTPVHILPARRPAPHHRLPTGTFIVHLAETNRTVPLHRLPLPLGISAIASCGRRQRRAGKHPAPLARQQRQLVHQVVARA